MTTKCEATDHGVFIVRRDSFGPINVVVPSCTAHDNSQHRNLTEFTPMSDVEFINFVDTLHKMKEELFVRAEECSSAEKIMKAFSKKFNVSDALMLEISVEYDLTTEWCCDEREAISDVINKSKADYSGNTIAWIQKPVLEIDYERCRIVAKISVR